MLVHYYYCRLTCIYLTHNHPVRQTGWPEYEVRYDI
jgi:hypothetical protein